MSLRFDLVVTYEDGTQQTVSAGQRECAAWERQPFGCGTSAAAEKSPMLFVRYLAFSSLWRLRMLPRNDDNKTVGFEEWDRMVDSVEDVSPDDDESPDPTKQSQPQEV